MHEGGVESQSEHILLHYEEGIELTREELLDTLVEAHLIAPVSPVIPEEIDHIREWGSGLSDEELVRAVHQAEDDMLRRYVDSSERHPRYPGVAIPR